jgi:hypothetical protein
MTRDQYIALAGVAATILGIVVTWIVAKRAQSRKELSYRLRMDSLLPRKISDPHHKLVIQYKGEELPEPILLSVDITNTGNVPIENPPIEISATGATYVIPGYFESCPPGYEDLRSVGRTDAESCAICLTHINPGQTARARLLMDGLPGDLPVFKCPMAGLEIKKQAKVEMNAAARVLLEILFPTLSNLIKSMD